ncbi:MAG: hypothetical protein K9N06_13195 [Candidatus Cloacimonetes bacterium]|nr:hypothetical protein [Candidatus Cloacimonadota bacterium]
MKIKIIYIVVFLSMSCLLSAVQLPNLQVEYSLDWSFWGGYYPQQEKKSYNYSDLLDLKAGFRSAPASNQQTWLFISFYNDEYEKKVRLEETGYTFQSASWQTGFLYKRETGIGAFSRIYSLDVTHKYYRQPAITSYNFGGLSFAYGTPQSQLFLKCGGNEYNNIIISCGWKRETAKASRNISLLLQGRDDYYQRQLAALNYEGYNYSRMHWLYNAFSTGFVMDTLKNKKEVFLFTGLSELIINITQSIRLGGNFNFEYRDNQEMEKSATLLTALDYKKNTINLLFRVDEWFLDNQMQSADLLLTHNFTPGMSTSLKSRLIFPQNSKKIYELGLQIKIK